MLHRPALLPATLALLGLPALASADTVHSSRDPEPLTRGCQSNAAAFHDNGDVVLVDYHGQWARHSRRNYSQNGGLDGLNCEIERIARIDSRGGLVWELRPTLERSEHGVARQDKIAGLLALPDGSTVVTSYGPGDGSPMDPKSLRHVAISRLGPDGELLWRTENTKAPKYAFATPHRGIGGELFVEFSLSNWGYAGGEFQLPDGKRWRLRKNEQELLIARLDPSNGRLVWESSGYGLISTAGGELLAASQQTRRRGADSRYRIARFSYHGELLAKSATPWLRRESWLSAARYGDKLVITTEHEQLNAAGSRVARRTGELHVYSLTGKPLSTRQLPDSARLAKPIPGGPLHIVSPTSCLRDRVIDVGCATEALEVLTLPSTDSPGTYSRIQLPETLFHNREFAIQSTRTGLWLRALTFAGDRNHGRGVTILHSRNGDRPVVTTPTGFVWRPKTSSNQPGSNSHSSPLDDLD